MTKILVTGATGFVGSALVRQLLVDAKYSVTAAVRNRTQQLNLNVKTVPIADLSFNTDWSAALLDVDVVIHTAARVHVMNDAVDDPLTAFRSINFEGTMALARQAVKAGVKRFIFLSSIKVNGEKTILGRSFTAADIPAPVDPYGISKAETEAALLELTIVTGLEVVIVRPVLVYGPGVKANFQSLMKWVHKGIPMPLGCVGNKRSLVALDNLVSLINICIEHPDAVNQIFLVSDSEDLSTNELLIRVGNALGKRARLFPLPVWMIRSVAILIGKSTVSQRLLDSLQVDISKTYELLKWRPKVNVDDALKKTVQTYLDNR